jgi:uncharacterized membrane protein
VTDRPDVAGGVTAAADGGPDDKVRRQFAVDRLVAFSDGVFAIIITILVLDIRVPDLGSGQSLRDSLDEVWPTLVSWVISFLLVGMYWVGHRSTFANVRYADIPTVWLNLLFLLPISLVPYAASAIGGYPDDPLALHLYGLVLVAVTCVRVILLAYLQRHPALLWHPPGRETRRLGQLAAAFPLLVYGVAMAVADASPALSRFLFFVVPGLYLLLVVLLRTDRRTRAAAEDIS